MRKPIPKKTRFEVFKRDKFTCQYCGRSAPDVILEVDHIKPVSKGGTNDVINLVTSCRDCNRGKSDKVLSDDSTVKIQREQLEDMQAKREQLEMMVAWKDELLKEDMMMVDAINRLVIAKTHEPAKGGGLQLSGKGKNEIQKLIKTFGFNEVYESTRLSYERYYDGTEAGSRTAFYKIGGICYNRRKAREGNAKQDP